MASATSATAGGTRVLIDSDVLIWLMRGNARAVALIQQTPDWTISAVSYMELVQGCRDKAELKALQKAFRSNEHDAQTDILPLITANKKHFSVIHGLQIQVFKP